MTPNIRMGKINCKAFLFALIFFIAVYLLHHQMMDLQKGILFCANNEKEPKNFQAEVPTEIITNETLDIGCRYEELNKRILEFYTRKTWWDATLCKEKFGAIPNNFSDIILLKTLNIDISPNNDHMRNIYFIESNCKTTIQFFVLCAIESAAQMNPNSTVFLLTVTPFLIDEYKAIQTLLNHHSNIQILQADYDDILQGTPLDGFRSEKVWTKNAAYLMAHLSDIVRTALVWKEGGTYLDSDIISIKGYPKFENAVIHGVNEISNAVITAKKNHAFLEVVLKHQKSHYNGNDWTSVGPKSVSAGLILYCNLTTFTAGTCKDVTIMSSKSFTPIFWNEADKVINPNSTINLTEFLRASYGLHTSHHVLKEKLNTVQKDSMYDKLTREFCSLSYKHVTHI